MDAQEMSMKQIADRKILVEPLVQYMQRAG